MENEAVPLHAMELSLPARGEPYNGLRRFPPSRDRPCVRPSSIEGSCGGLCHFLGGQKSKHDHGGQQADAPHLAHRVRHAVGSGESFFLHFYTPSHENN